MLLVFLSRSQQKTIINAMAVNEEGVMATGGRDFIHSGCELTSISNGLVSDVQGTPSAFYFCIRVFCFFFPSLFFWTGSKKWCLPVTPHWGWQLVSRINSYIFLILPPFVYARWQREYVVLGLEEWSQFSAIPNNCTAWYVFRAFSICSLWLWGWKWP